MYVRPAPGIKIRDPDLMDFIPAEGREVPDTGFWIRRLRDGDVISGALAVAAKRNTTDRSQEQ
jgi:hypothetical protein